MVIDVIGKETTGYGNKAINMYTHIACDVVKNDFESDDYGIGFQT